MARTLVSVLMIVVLAVASFGQVVFTDVEYVTETGDVFDVGQALPGNRPGALRAKFEFWSDRIDGSTGLYAQPVIEASWALRLSDGSYRSALPDGEWVARTSPALVHEMAQFDPQTGFGVAELVLPMCTTDVREFYRYPGLAEDVVAVDVVADWLDELAFDLAGAPAAPRWVGSVAVSVTHDDVFALLAQKHLAPSDVTVGVVGLRTAATAARSFELESTDARVASLDVSQVTIPAGATSASFEVTGNHRGVFRIIVREHAQEVAGTPRRAVVSKPKMYAATLTTGAGGAPLWRGTDDLELDEWIARCVPPHESGNGKMNHKLCGTCQMGTPTVDCPGDAVLAMPAECELAVDSCKTEGTDVVSGPVYEYVGTTVIDCVSILGIVTWKAECCLYQKSATDFGEVDMAACKDD